MPKIDLFIVGFGRPDLLHEQLRLIDLNVKDDHTVCLLDNTTGHLITEMRSVCHEHGATYRAVPSHRHEHNDALNYGVQLAENSSHYGFLDHDIFPLRPTELISRIDQAGFLGMGQTYSPRVGAHKRYLWPGWCFFSASWLNGRRPNFDGIRGEFKWDDGDCGSMLHTLFTAADWKKLPDVRHSYGVVRPDDGHGLQSIGYELIDDWVHFTNASLWKTIPNPSERDQLLKELLR